MIAYDEVRKPTRAELKKARLSARERFRRAHRAEKTFAKQLRSVASQVDALVRTMAPKSDGSDFGLLQNALHRYSEILRPWATAVSEKLIAETGQRDERAWISLGRELGQNLQAEIRNTPVGKTFKRLMDEQVDLITSLPLDAAKRVHHVVREAQITGTRAKETMEEIMRTGEVTKSRAMLIARTETTRTAISLMEARARHIGVEQYIWRTSGDGDVRKQHKKLEGKVFNWDDPPVTGPSGERSHPGGIFNCRCWAEPIIPDDL